MSGEQGTASPSLTVTPEYFARLLDGSDMPSPPQSLVDAMLWAESRIVPAEPEQNRNDAPQTEAESASDLR